MGLYLCIFEGDEDIDGVEVGSYADFNALRGNVVQQLEGGRAGSRFPTLTLHSDCEGEWSVADCQILQGELTKIAAALKELPVIGFTSDWQRVVAKSIGLKPQNAFESFIDVDGEFLLERLQCLAQKAVRHQLPIVFQ
jgi:hypothetical protein